MTDITDTHLEAALLDQKVAGAFSGKTYAFVPVVARDGWELGVAVANERGYHPIKGKTFATEDAADVWADSLNEHIGLSKADVIGITISTMGGMPFGHGAH